MRWLVLGLVAAGVIVAVFDPAGARWAGVAALAGAMLIGGFGAARAGRRRSMLRTLEGLRRLPPGDFEVLVGQWLRREGWAIEHRGGPGDGGIDLFARRKQDVMVVQCKRYTAAGTVGVAQVRDLYGAATAAGATMALLVTTGDVSAPAQAWAAGLTSGPRVILAGADRVAAAARGARLTQG